MQNCAAVCCAALPCALHHTAPHCTVLQSLHFSTHSTMYQHNLLRFTNLLQTAFFHTWHNLSYTKENLPTAYVVCPGKVYLYNKQYLTSSCTHKPPVNNLPAKAYTWAKPLSSLLMYEINFYTTLAMPIKNTLWSWSYATTQQKL